MTSDEDRIKELELEVQSLEHEVDTYPKASEDALQQREEITVPSSES